MIGAQLLFDAGDNAAAGAPLRDALRAASHTTQGKVGAAIMLGTAAIGVAAGAAAFGSPLHTAG